MHIKHRSSNCLRNGGIESADTSMNTVESLDGDMSPCELWVEIMDMFVVEIRWSVDGIKKQRNHRLT